MERGAKKRKVTDEVDLVVFGSKLTRWSRRGGVPITTIGELVLILVATVARALTPDTIQELNGAPPAHTLLSPPQTPQSSNILPPRDRRTLSHPRRPQVPPRCVDVSTAHHQPGSTLHESSHPLPRAFGSQVSGAST